MELRDLQSHDEATEASVSQWHSTCQPRTAVRMNPGISDILHTVFFYCFKKKTTNILQDAKTLLKA